MSKITFYKPEKAVQTRPYDSNTFNKQDGEEIKNAVNALYDLLAESENSILGYEPLNSTNWNAGFGTNKRVFTMVDPNTSIAITGTSNGGTYMLYVIQGGAGDNKLQINGEPVEVNSQGGTLIAIHNIDDILEYYPGIAAGNDIPKITNQSPMYITVIEGEDLQLFVEVDRSELVESFVLERNGDPVPKATGAEYQDKASEDTAKAYAFELQLKNGKKIRSKAMFVTLGEAAEPVYVSGASDFSVNAGENFKRKVIFTGTPTPEITSVKVVNGNDVAFQSGDTIDDAVTFSTIYAFIATNKFKVDSDEVLTPPVYAEDGTTVITQAVYKKVYQTNTTRSPNFTITPIKQSQPAPGQFTYNSNTRAIDLAALPSGKSLSDYRVIINDKAPITPTSLSVPVGNDEVLPNKVDVYFAETLTLSKSPSVYNSGKIPALLENTFDIDFKTNVSKAQKVSTDEKGLLWGPTTDDLYAGVGKASDLSIPVGQEAIIYCEWTGNSSNGVILGFNASDEPNPSYTSTLASFTYIPDSGNVPTFYVNKDNLTQPAVPGMVPITAGILLGVHRFSDGTVKACYSTNGGTSFIDIGDVLGTLNVMVFPTAHFAGTSYGSTLHYGKLKRIIPA